MRANGERSSLEFRAVSFRGRWTEASVQRYTAPLPNHFTIAPVLVLTPATLLAWWHLLQVATGTVNHHRTACSVSVVISTHSCDSFVATTSAVPLYSCLCNERPPAFHCLSCTSYLPKPVATAFPCRRVSEALEGYTCQEATQWLVPVCSTTWTVARQSPC